MGTESSGPGPLFCLLADIEISRPTGNDKSLEGRLRLNPSTLEVLLRAVSFLDFATPS
jgi:hypothetical protein